MLHKESLAETSLYATRGVRVVHPVKCITYKCKAVRTSEGFILIPDRPDLSYAMSVEDIQKAYGGEIIEIEMMRSSSKNDTTYIHSDNFPRVKNRKALDCVYEKYKKYMDSLSRRTKTK